ncbi:hypothetical protein ACWD4B_34810 [Streptomyces sp. NPDC002536]
MTNHGDTGHSTPPAQPSQDVQGDTPTPGQDDDGGFARSSSEHRPGLWQRLKAAWNGEI